MAKEGSFINKFLVQIRFPIRFVILMWGFHLIGFLTLKGLGGYGIYPRTLSGLLGILTAPLVHGDFQHLMGNTFPMLFLTSMLFLLYKRIAKQVFVSLYISTGFMVWLVARESMHIGASGVVYALVSFLFWTGIFRRNIRSIAISLVILVLYSSYFLGILPDQPGISWESHLMGGIMGILVAYLFRNSIEDDEKPEEDSFPDEVRRPYFDNGTFDMTKQEREILRRENDGGWFTTSS